MTRASLPVRTPLRTQTMETALRLRQEGECYDRGVLERVAAGLRELDTLRRIPENSAQQEVDGVIARWQATHPGRVRGAS